MSNRPRPLVLLLMIASLGLDDGSAQIAKQTAAIILTLETFEKVTSVDYGWWVMFEKHDCQFSQNFQEKWARFGAMYG